MIDSHRLPDSLDGHYVERDARMSLATALKGAVAAARRARHAGQSALRVAVRPASGSARADRLRCAGTENRQRRPLVDRPERGVHTYDALAVPFVEFALKAAVIQDDHQLDVADRDVDARAKKVAAELTV